MWTICWTEDGVDRWDRLPKSALIKKLKELEGMHDEDYIVFAPDSELTANQVDKIIHSDREVECNKCGKRFPQSKLTPSGCCPYCRSDDTYWAQ